MPCVCRVKRICPERTRAQHIGIRANVSRVLQSSAARSCLLFLLDVTTSVRGSQNSQTEGLQDINGGCHLDLLECITGSFAMKCCGAHMDS